jgi:chemotaxis protein MotB
MKASQGTTRIIIKKNRHGGGHHGGAWKVAYADFVTTMMALFIVLWIVGQGSATKEAIAKYFRDPGVFKEGGASTVIPGGTGIFPGERMPVGGNEVEATKNGAAMREEAALQGAARRLGELASTSGVFDKLKNQIKIQVGKEGLRIELMERDNSPFYQVGNPILVPSAVEVLQRLAVVLQSLPNPITIEGHTDSRQYSTSRQYSNWELSSDRANSARRVLEAASLPEGRIDRVIGHADRIPMVQGDPLDAMNRRISIIVRRMGQEP